MTKILYPGLVAEMARRGETQNTLAELLGTTYSAIHRRMLGEKDWSITEIDKICEYYKKDYYELFKDEVK